MYCKNCDKNIADGLEYCDICGADLNAGAIAGFMHTAEIFDPTHNPGKKLGLISLILGSVILVLNFPCCLSLIPLLGNIISVLSFFTLPGGICSIILGFIARKKSKAYGFSNKTAVTGIIMGVVATTVGIISFIIGLIYALGYFGIGIGIVGFAFFADM